MDNSKNVSKESPAVDQTIYNLRRNRTPSTKKKESEMEPDTKPPRKKSRRSIENNTRARDSVFTERQDTPGSTFVGQKLENLTLGGGSAERGEPRINAARSSTLEQGNDKNSIFNIRLANISLQSTHLSNRRQLFSTKNSTSQVLMNLHQIPKLLPKDHHKASTSTPPTPTPTSTTHMT